MVVPRLNILIPRLSLGWYGFPKDGYYYITVVSRSGMIIPWLPKVGYHCGTVVSRSARLYHGCVKIGYGYTVVVPRLAMVTPWLRWIKNQASLHILRVR